MLTIMACLVMTEKEEYFSNLVDLVKSVGLLCSESVSENDVVNADQQLDFAKTFKDCMV